MESLLDRMAAMESRQAAAERRVTLWRALALLVITIALVLLSLRGVTAQGGQSGGLPALEARVAALETMVANQATQIQALQTALNNEVAARQAGDTNLQNQLTPLTNLLLAKNQFGRPYFSRQGDDITIEAANLHIVNGMGATNGYPADPFSTDPSQTVVNGLGNLIVGYNEARAPFGLTDDRSGSHNLVVGSFQNFSSFGGLVAGFFNTVSGPWASVSGGFHNTASGQYASVSGGFVNNAGGSFASVSGGDFNTASGNRASVSGGDRNTASGNFASVSGGAFNIASGFAASVTGGGVNTATGGRASVSGGFHNTVDGDHASVSGGAGVNASADDSWAAGGFFLPNPPGGPGTFHSP